MTCHTQDSYILRGDMQRAGNRKKEQEYFCTLFKNMSWCKPYVKKCICSELELQGSRITTNGNLQLQKFQVLGWIIVSVQIRLLVSAETMYRTLSVDDHLALMSCFHCRKVPCSDERGTTSCCREDKCIRSRSLQNKKTSGTKCYLILKQLPVTAALRAHQ